MEPGAMTTFHAKEILQLRGVNGYNVCMAVAVLKLREARACTAGCSDITRKEENTMNETSKTAIANRGDQNWHEHRREEYWRPLLSMGTEALKELWKLGKTAIRLRQEQELMLCEVARQFNAPLEAAIIAQQLERAYPTFEEFDAVVSRLFTRQYDKVDLQEFLAALWGSYPNAKDKNSIRGYVASVQIGWYPAPDMSSVEGRAIEHGRLRDREGRSGLRKRIFGFDAS